MKKLNEKWGVCFETGLKTNEKFLKKQAKPFFGPRPVQTKMWPERGKMENNAPGAEILKKRRRRRRKIEKRHQKS